MTFPAPDNLTAYRLMAVAADGGERFGSGDQRVTVRKPLQLLGAMPRFFNVGDKARGGVLVVNNTGQPGAAIVDATVTGARLHKAARRRARSPPAGACRSPSRCGRTAPARLKLRVKVALGGETDGLSSSCRCGIQRRSRRCWSPRALPATRRRCR